MKHQANPPRSYIYIFIQHFPYPDIIHLLAFFYLVALSARIFFLRPAFFKYSQPWHKEKSLGSGSKVRRDKTMIQRNTGTSNSSREYKISFETAPPVTARPGVPFNIPVVIAVWPLGHPGNTKQLVMNASLRSETGTNITSNLAGALTSSVLTGHGNTKSGYASFSPLTIKQPGRYRLRIMLAVASYEDITTKEYVESGVIHAHAGAAATQRPSRSCFCYG